MDSGIHYYRQGEILMVLKYAEIVFVILFISTTLFSQGVFLQKGGYGLGVESGYNYGDNYYDFHGKFGYTFNGIFDMGMAFRKGVATERVLGYNLNSLSLNPFIAIIERSDPIMLSVSFSYQHDFINSDAFDILNIKASGDYYSVGSSVRLRASESESFFLQPSINAKYVAGREIASGNSPTSKQSMMGNEFYLSKLSVRDDSIYQKIPAGQTRSNFTQELILGFGVDLCFRTSDGIILYITPNVVLEKENKSIGINAGFVLPTTNISKTKQLKSNRKALVMQQQGVIYINIENAMKRHFLVYMNNKTPMKVGDSFSIVRAGKKNQQSLEWTEIGTATVVKIQDNKVVLESNLQDRNDQVTTSDKILFSY